MPPTCLTVNKSPRKSVRRFGGEPIFFTRQAATAQQSGFLPTILLALSITCSERSGEATRLGRLQPTVADTDLGNYGTTLTGRKSLFAAGPKAHIGRVPGRELSGGAKMKLRIAAAAIGVTGVIGFTGWLGTAWATDDDWWWNPWDPWVQWVPGPFPPGRFPFPPPGHGGPVPGHWPGHGRHWAGGPGDWVGDCQ